MGTAAHNKNTAGAANPSKLIVVAGVLVCLALSVVTLYPALKEYYVAFRTSQQLLQEYDAVQERNLQIREQISYLNTIEGIADRARERFGWVLQGETAVNITGITATDASAGLPAAVPAGSRVAPEEWWTPLLDAVFALETDKPVETVPDPFYSN